MKHSISICSVLCLTMGFMPAVRADETPLPAAVGELQLSDEEMIEVHTDIKQFFAGLGEARDLAAEVAALNGGPLSAEQVEELEAFRAEMGLLLTAVRAKTAGEGERERLARTHRQVRRSTPEGLFVLRAKFTANVAWPRVSERLSDAALEALRPLAAHGPLTRSDRAELEELRAELVALLASIESLPAAARSQIDLPAGGSLAGKVADLPSETLFLLRGRVDRDGLRQARQGVQVLARISEMTAEDLRALPRAPATNSQEFSVDTAALAKDLSQINLPHISKIHMSCGIGSVNPCKLVKNKVNNKIINPINDIIDEIEDGLNVGIDAFNAIEDLFDLLLDPSLDNILENLLGSAASLAEEAMTVIGPVIEEIDNALGQSIGVLREFVDDVKKPFIGLIEDAGDPARESALLTQLDAFMFNRDEGNGPLGLVTCMEEVLCAQTEIVEFEVVLPSGDTEIHQEQLCRQGKFIPLIGEVGSDRSVFACMVIKNEVAFLKDLMPEDTLPGGKIADIGLSSFVHKLDQLCSVNDWMAGNRNLLLSRIATTERNARFRRILGSCTLDGTELDCDDLPVGKSIADIVNGTAQAVDGVQDSVDALTVDVRDAREAILGSLEAHDQALAEHDARLVDLMSLNLQFQIEDNLMESAPTFVIASFQAPEQAGGYLATTAGVVQAAIATAVSGGLNVNFAEDFFAQAEELRAEERYKEAYLMYRRAYREVVSLP